MNVSVENITFKYDDTVILNDLSLTIESGQYIAIVGANGSGKTTLARILAGLLLPQSGSVKIDDKTITEDNIYDLREHIGMVFQNPEDQFVGVTVRDDIAFGLENYGVEREEMIALIDEFSKRTGVHELLSREPSHLSGGQKQRVAIASALALHPDFIIFDEATSMLDPEGRRDVQAVIRELFNETHKTIIMITHDLDEALASDRMIVMNQGVVVADDHPHTIFASDIDLGQYQLAEPFVVELSKTLKAAGLIDRIYFDEEELVQAL